MFWLCPHNDELEDDAVQSTQAFAAEASRECHLNPAFWLRGMLGSSLLPAFPLFLSSLLHFVDGLLHHPPPFSWPDGDYYTDGSGGKFASPPYLRRVGCGIARLDELYGHFGYAWGAFFALPGLVQTVPRAELFAVIVLCLHAAPCAHLRVFSDSLMTVQGIHDKRQKR